MTKRMIPKKTPKEERKVVSIRNVSVARWEALQEKARAEGRAVWALLDEALDYILNKEE